MKKIFLTIFIFLSLASTLIAKEKITDIQVEGLQRIDVGLVFNSIPFEINDDIENVDFSETINLLYKTGQFRDVTVERVGSVIIISLREKPLLFKLNFFGTEMFQPEALEKALVQMNIASGQVLDESDVSRAEKEITNQYLSNGKYTASVKVELEKLANNRVNLNFYIDEGRISRIKEISILGNKIFLTKDILDEMTLKTTNYMSWWNKDDRYSKQELTGDLEKIRSFYFDRGYLDFKIESSIVSISKSRKDVFIALTLSEGKRYQIGNIKISGNLPQKVEFKDLEKLIKVKEGEIFSRKLINDSTKEISKYLGNFGYAFANVNALPTIEKDDLIVNFNFVIDHGKKIYVRRVNIVGNESTKDKVIRRELRQYESSWFSQEKVDISKVRLNKTQYFESVNIETPVVPGTADQVDMNIIVKETNTGKFQIGAGVSSSEGIVGTLSLSQANFLGTGNQVGTEISTGGVNKTYSLSFVDPYWTDDGVSRGLSIYKRDVDTKELNTGTYNTESYGLGISFGIPLSEFETFKIGAKLDFTKLDLRSNSPQGYKDFCSSVASQGSLNCDSDSISFYTSWINDTKNNVFFPTSGHKIQLSADATIPALDLQYFKLEASGEQFYPISESVTTKLRGSVGWADSYGDEVFPFFKNFRAGGKSSIRGYKEGSVGKKTYDSSSSSWVTYGGTKKITLGVETYFPVPFVKKSDGYRLSAFIDGGAVFEDSFNGGDMRYSAGLGVLWISPMGPLNVSFGIPLNEGAHDQTEKLQFGMGSSF
jgi:outer membrane protein insertion porin family